MTACSAALPLYKGQKRTVSTSLCVHSDSFATCGTAMPSTPAWPTGVTMTTPPASSDMQDATRTRPGHPNRAKERCLRNFFGFNRLQVPPINIDHNCIHQQTFLAQAGHHNPRAWLLKTHPHVSTTRADDTLCCYCNWFSARTLPQSPAACGQTAAAAPGPPCSAAPAPGFRQQAQQGPA